MKSLFFKLTITVLSVFIITGFLPAFSLYEEGYSNSFDEKEKSQIFKKELNDFVEEFEVAGVQVGVVEDGEVAFIGSAGMHDIESEKELDDNSIFRSASISKTFTAVALMQLVEQGKIDLDEDINKYLELDVEIENPEHPEISITPRMLLNHTSSMLNGTYVSFSSSSIRESSPPSLAEVFDKEGEFYSDANWSDTKPGEKFIYSNLGYIVLGAIIENVSEMDFNSYTNRNIFLPLEMESSSFNINDLKYDSKKGNISPLYIRKEVDGEVEFDKIKLGSLPEYTDYIPGSNGAIYSPHGGLLSTASDLSNFVEAMINKGKYQDRRILNECTVQQMEEISVEATENDRSNFYGLYEKKGLGLHITRR